MQYFNFSQVFGKNPSKQPIFEIKLQNPAFKTRAFHES